MFCNQAAFRHLQASGGSIINFGSDAGLKPGRVGADYAATKGRFLPIPTRLHLNGADTGSVSIRSCRLSGLLCMTNSGNAWMPKP